MACIQKIYDYRDEDGQLVYQICRMEPKSFRARRPLGNGQWAWGLEAGKYYQTAEGDWRQGKDSARPTMDLPKVVRLPYLMDRWYRGKLSQPVLVVEGEKDADTLNGLGYFATTLPGGSTEEDYFRLGGSLSDRRVVVIPDNDRPGLEKAAKVAAALILYGCESIRVLRWPTERQEGWDVTDEVGLIETLESIKPTDHGYKAKVRDMINQLVLACSTEYRPTVATMKGE